MSILTFSNFLNETECQEYIELITTKVSQNFTDSGNFTNKKWIDFDLAQSFFDKIPCNEEYIKPNNLIMSGTYKPGDSFGLHTDTGLYYNPRESLKSRWTLLIYLNDDFSGGETVFYDDSWKVSKVITPEKGKALLFDIDLWHKGNEVISGTKHWIGCEIIGTFNHL